MTSPINPIQSPNNSNAATAYAANIAPADRSAGVLTEKAVKQLDVTSPSTKVDASNSAQQEVKSTKVSLSPDAEMMARLMRELKKEPPIDQDKVAKIKAQIATGEYKLDTLSISREIMRIERLWQQSRVQSNPDKIAE